MEDFPCGLIFSSYWTFIGETLYNQRKITRAASDGSSKSFVFPTKNNIRALNQCVQSYERVSTTKYDQHTWIWVCLKTERPQISSFTSIILQWYTMMMFMFPMKGASPVFPRWGHSLCGWYPVNQKGFWLRKFHGWAPSILPQPAHPVPPETWLETTMANWILLWMFHGFHEVFSNCKEKPHNIRSWLLGGISSNRSSDAVEISKQETHNTWYDRGSVDKCWTYYVLGSKHGIWMYIVHGHSYKMGVLHRMSGLTTKSFIGKL